MSESPYSMKSEILYDEGVYKSEVKICNKKGLHARAAAKFVKCTEKYTANVTVTRLGETVGGTSIMGLMMLAASIGCSILIESQGPQAKEAIEALVELVETRFGEPE